MIRSISAEWLKLRHSRIGLLLAVLPVVSLLIGCANYYANQGVLGNGWYSLWTQVSLFYGEFFLPILIAICCSYLARLEHVNRNWNMTMSSPVSPASVFFAKWFVAGLLILLAQILFVLLYWLAGNLLALEGGFPPETVGWIMRGWYASLAIGALQLALSLKMRSFATPIGICLCAVFAGLGFYVAKLGLFFPFSLLTIGMGVLSQNKLEGFQHVMFWVSSTGFILLFAAMSISRLKRKDIVS
ncbi:multidrug ABC transporter permease [Paenibacillus oryzae]|uniref:Multidrug ABC transporter permease n=1 Tax=Paenibacillus oryzae TaxID=1844972 RepID=A0A1A5YJV3_9BACL|nr:ABC transporter permease [Paenibacillus oryzae]OBR65670.1 multidrug ABC transporter permease [Paenibacillus oryzae]